MKITSVQDFLGLVVRPMHRGPFVGRFTQRDGYVMGVTVHDRVVLYGTSSGRPEPLTRQRPHAQVALAHALFRLGAMDRTTRDAVLTHLREAIRIDMRRRDEDTVRCLARRLGVDANAIDALLSLAAGKERH